MDEDLLTRLGHLLDDTKLQIKFDREALGRANLDGFERVMISAVREVLVDVLEALLGETK